MNAGSGDVQSGSRKSFPDFEIVDLTLGLSCHLPGNACGLHSWQKLGKTCFRYTVRGASHPVKRSLLCQSLQIQLSQSLPTFYELKH
jgi:hypothetical protein